MPRKWMPSPEQQVHLDNAANENVALAATFSVSEATIRRARREGRSAVAEPQAQTVAPAGPSETDMLRDEVRQLRARARRDERGTVGDERALLAIEAAADRVRPVDTWVEFLPEPAAAGAHHRQAAVWSDWHYGEVVDHAAMGGLAEYNIEIAEARVDQLVSSMLSFKANRPELTGLDIWLLGDMASGQIHGLEETNEVPAAEQFVRVGYLIASAIERLAPHYANLHVTCTFGNHPRPNPEPASKAGHNNGDWIAYKMAEACTRHLANVSWTIPHAGMVVTEIAGKTFLLWHGDGVRSSMPGVPWGGVMRRWNVLKSTYAARGVYLDYVALGHFHQSCTVPGVFMNGSLIGENEYGLKNFGGGGSPIQMLLTFDEKRGRLTDVSYISFED